MTALIQRRPKDVYFAAHMALLVDDGAPPHPLKEVIEMPENPSPIARRRLLTAGGVAAGAAAATLIAQSPAAAAPVNPVGAFTDGPGQIVVPFRAFDSRTMSAKYGGGVFEPGNERTVMVIASVQPGPSADHVFLTVTVTGTTGAGYLTVFPADYHGVPNTSTINWSGPGQTLSAGVLTPCQVVAVSTNYHRSLVKVRFSGTGRVHVIVDVTSTYGVPKG